MPGPLMRRSDQVQWAKEVVLGGADEAISLALNEDISDIALDDEVELLRQRNRVARFLGLPEKEKL